MKNHIFILAFLILSGSISAQTMKYHLSSHVLDISCGLPAANVEVKLEKIDTISQKWMFIDTKTTDENGRIPNFLPVDNSKNENYKGTYKLTFYTKPYFENKNIKTFYPFIEVSFEINDNNHYHVPITLSPFGYSTYKGS